MMEWKKLLSTTRLCEDVKKEDEDRSPFQKDVDRIIFSSAFRRLQGKTQVHILPKTDYVRTRLTHSLEVSSVGRSLGTIVGHHISENSLEISSESIGFIVQAACLAHDIGNPPYGHSGENSIQAFFAEQDEKEKPWSSFSDSQILDLKNYEGNAQGFRTITKLQGWKDNGGLRLTLATLATFMKYPCDSLSSSAEDKNYIGERKFGFFQAEKAYFETVANSVGLLPRKGKGLSWSRHPLSFLVEAADDICYAVIDVEDGYKMGLIDFETAKGQLLAIADKYDRLDKVEGEPDQISYLRAKAIGSLIRAAAKRFKDKEDEILSGEFNEDLLVENDFPEVKKAKKLAKGKVFESTEIAIKEVAGYHVISGILSELVQALYGPRKKQSEKLLKLIDHPIAERGDDYEAILELCDYVAGMTDKFALNLFRGIRGISV